MSKIAVTKIAKKNSPKQGSTKTTKNQASSDEHDFTDTVAKQIAFEAHLFCSSPTCCRLTTYSTSSGKARSIAEAAHVNGSRLGGPRPSVKEPSFLKSAANGIWLCRICHRKVDDAPETYTEDVLFEWKKDHAKFIQKMAGADIDLLYFETYVRTRNLAQTRAFLAFLEGRRVFFDGMEAELPTQVLDSLSEVRRRLDNTIAFLKKDELANKNFREMRAEINSFLTKNPRIDQLNSQQSGSEAFGRFCADLWELRKKTLTLVVEVAKDSDYELSESLLHEYELGNSET